MRRTFSKINGNVRRFSIRNQSLKDELKTQKRRVKIHVEFKKNLTPKSMQVRISGSHWVVCASHFCDSLFKRLKEKSP